MKGRIACPQRSAPRLSPSSSFDRLKKEDSDARIPTSASTNATRVSRGARPHAGPGQVVVRVAGSGLCHTDFTVISRERGYWKDQPPPFTLGHEIAGWVEELGTGVARFRAGRCCRDQSELGKLRPMSHVPVRGREPLPLSEGHSCSWGRLRRRTRALRPRPRSEIPRPHWRSRSDQRRAPYRCGHHDIHRDQVCASWNLARQHGGSDRRRRVGSYAVQFLRQLTGARVVAVDSTEARLKLAREYGADDVVLSGPDAAEHIRELSGGVGATFVLDCVGVNATLATAVAALSWRGRLVMVGAGGGSIPFDFFKVPPGGQLGTSLNGGSIALMEVVGLAALGRLKILVDRYPLNAAKQAYDDFEHGRLVGRAVLMPAPLDDANGATNSSHIAGVTTSA